MQEKNVSYRLPINWQKCEGAFSPSTAIKTTDVVIPLEPELQELIAEDAKLNGISFQQMLEKYCIDTLKATTAQIKTRLNR